MVSRIRSASAGLSSTKSTCTRSRKRSFDIVSCFAVGGDLFGSGRRANEGIGRTKREENGGAFAEAGFEPDRPAVTFDDLLGDCESDSIAFVRLAIVEPLKHLKQPIDETLLDANPIVADREAPELSASLGAYPYEWSAVRPKFEPVANEVL